MGDVPLFSRDVCHFSVMTRYYLLVQPVYILTEWLTGCVFHVVKVFKHCSETFGTMLCFNVIENSMCWCFEKYFEIIRGRKNMEGDFFTNEEIMGVSLSSNFEKPRSIESIGAQSNFLIEWLIAYCFVYERMRKYWRGITNHKNHKHNMPPCRCMKKGIQDDLISRRTERTLKMNGVEESGKNGWIWFVVIFD